MFRGSCQDRLRGTIQLFQVVIGPWATGLEFPPAGHSRPDWRQCGSVPALDFRWPLPRIVARQLHASTDARFIYALGSARKPIPWHNSFAANAGLATRLVPPADTSAPLPPPSPDGAEMRAGAGSPGWILVLGIRAPAADTDDDEERRRGPIRKGRVRARWRGSAHGRPGEISPARGGLWRAAPPHFTTRTIELQPALRRRQPAGEARAATIIGRSGRRSTGARQASRDGIPLFDFRKGGVSTPCGQVVAKACRPSSGYAAQLPAFHSPQGCCRRFEMLPADHAPCSRRT